MEHLNISFLGQITDQTLRYMPNLKKLICMQCNNIKDDGLCTLVESCESIEMMDLSFCFQITNSFVDAAINATKNRTNNIILNLHLDGTSVDSNKINEKSPLLRMTLPTLYDNIFEGSTYSYPTFYGSIFPFICAMFSLVDADDDYYISSDEEFYDNFEDEFRDEFDESEVDEDEVEEFEESDEEYPG